MLDAGTHIKRNNGLSGKGEQPALVNVCMDNGENGEVLERALSVRLQSLSTGCKTLLLDVCQPNDLVVKLLSRIRSLGTGIIRPASVAVDRM